MQEYKLIDNLGQDEAKVVLAMRRYGPFASFKIEKRPTREKPEGELLKVTTEIRQTMRSVEYEV